MDTGSLPAENQRKLLLGEIVEVRQKEDGLLGAWYPGVIVKVYLGKRSVEYYDLLSKDGRHRLRECIPVPPGVEGSIFHLKNTSRSPSQKKRAYIRPRPPPCMKMPQESWKKGMWVDAFYEDAWWEGILLEDVLLVSDDCQVRVSFPDEGDELYVYLKDLRLLQEWDDITNSWSIKGSSLSELTCPEASIISDPHEDVKTKEHVSSPRTRLKWKEHVSSLRMQSKASLISPEDRLNAPKLLTPTLSNRVPCVANLPGTVNHREKQNALTSAPEEITSSEPRGDVKEKEHVSSPRTRLEWKEHVSALRMQSKTSLSSPEDRLNAPKLSTPTLSNQVPCVADVSGTINHNEKQKDLTPSPEEITSSEPHHEVTEKEHVSSPRTRLKWKRHNSSLRMQSTTSLSLPKDGLRVQKLLTPTLSNLVPCVADVPGTVNHKEKQNELTSSPEEITSSEPCNEVKEKVLVSSPKTRLKWKKHNSSLRMQSTTSLSLPKDGLCVQKLLMPTLSNPVPCVADVPSTINHKEKQNDLTLSPEKITSSEPRNEVKEKEHVSSPRTRSKWKKHNSSLRMQSTTSLSSPKDGLHVQKLLTSTLSNPVPCVADVPSTVNHKEKQNDLTSSPEEIISSEPCGEFKEHFSSPRTRLKWKEHNSSLRMQSTTTLSSPEDRLNVQKLMTPTLSYSVPCVADVPGTVNHKEKQNSLTSSPEEITNSEPCGEFKEHFSSPRTRLKWKKHNSSLRMQSTTTLSSPGDRLNVQKLLRPTLSNQVPCVADVPGSVNLKEKQIDLTSSPEEITSSEPHGEFKVKEHVSSPRTRLKWKEHNSSLRMQLTTSLSPPDDRLNIQKPLTPPLSNQVPCVADVPGTVNHKENQTDLTSSPEESGSVLPDTSVQESKTKEETLGDWMRAAKQQVLKGRAPDDVKHASGDVMKLNERSPKSGISAVRIVSKKAKKLTEEIHDTTEDGETLVHTVSNPKMFEPKNGKVPLDDSSFYSNVLIRHVVQEGKDRARKTLLEAGWRIHVNSSCGIERVSRYDSPDGVHYSSLLAACREWQRVHGSETDSKSLEENGILQVLSGYMLPKDRKMLQEACCRAKQTLEKAGWRVGFRLRNGIKIISHYRAPDGARHYSLSSACREWRRVHGCGIDSKVLEENGILQILNAYKCMEEPCNGEKKVLKVSHSPMILTRSKFLRTSAKMKLSSQTPLSCNLLDRKNPIQFSQTCSQHRASNFSESHGGYVKSRFKGKRRWKQKLRFTDRKYKKGGIKFLVETVQKKKKLLQRTNATEPRSRKRKYNKHNEILTDNVKVKRRRRASEVPKPCNRTGVRPYHRRGLVVHLSAPVREKTEAGNVVFLTKKTILSWLMDMGVLTENEKVMYLNRKGKHAMMEGQVTRDGILCKCCKSVLTLSNFEAHAGSTLHRPCANIFLADGRSLLDCQIQALKIKGEPKIPVEAGGESHNGDLDGSDDTCGICGDGGQLICCDHCPSTFHLDCVQIENVPENKWCCPHCRCVVCEGDRFTAHESLMDKSKLFCRQCACEYHVACLKDTCMRKREESLERTWFCGYDCEKIYERLRGLVGITNALEDGFSWTLLRSAEEDNVSSTEYSLEVATEHNSKLALALSVMQECFCPMIDSRTQFEIITHILYNRRSELKRMNFGGFYTLILERGDELVSVASVRVHGTQLAEMPLIGTRFQYRRQGMCRRLMTALEKILQSLHIQILVLPAIPELLETWTMAFGFQPMIPLERLKFLNLSVVAFPGTMLLQKSLVDLLPASHSSGVASSGVQAPGDIIKATRKRGRPPKKNKNHGNVVMTLDANAERAALETLSEVMTSDCNEDGASKTIENNFDVGLSSQSGKVDGPTYVSDTLHLCSNISPDISFQNCESAEVKSSSLKPKLTMECHGKNKLPISYLVFKKVQ